MYSVLTKKLGINVMVRDHIGHVIVSEWKFVSYRASAEVVEVLAYLEGLKHLIRLGRWPATLEYDCLRVVQMMSSSNEGKSECWSLFLEARELMMRVVF
jgi:hypothetical protein